MKPVQHHARRVLDRYAPRAARSRQDLAALQILAPLSTGYLPWSSFALRPSALVGILNEIVIHRRRRVVELGGGVSTLYLGRLLQRLDGRQDTVEHDEDWATLLDEQLAAEGLGEVVNVVHAPLAPTSRGWEPGAQWYAEDKVADLRSGEPVDLLVVDGPPAWSRERRHARYPALPFFRDLLAPRAAVILDDIDRRGEREVVARWEDEHGIAFERRFSDGSIAVGRLPGPA